MASIGVFVYFGGGRQLNRLRRHDWVYLAANSAGNYTQ
jgi:hypothetical protein